MLKKLLKYDLKNNFKILIIFYSLSIFFAVLTRILFSIENSFIIDVIAKISSGVTISMMFNIIINNIMGLWGRTKNNFYGDESYLTHTLPVDRKTLYLSKTLTSTVTLFTSMLVIALTLFIAYYSKENLDIVKSFLLPIADAYDSSIMKILVAILFILFLEISTMLQSGYTGIILGHRKNNHKIVLSIIFGLIAYSVSQIFVLITLFITSLFNKDLLNLFITNNQIINIDMIKLIIILSIITYTILNIIQYIVNTKLFEKGVNID